jgi:hypothetical protein
MTLCIQDRVAQWIRRLPTEQEILGSIPSMVVVDHIETALRFCIAHIL